jgi:hypothetical protein
MHFNFHFTAVQILWTLTFASLLVLLVVLYGRDRVRRFPWFTASVSLVALRLLTNRLLHDRLPPITMGEIVITLANVAALVGFIVLIEMARRAFGRASVRAWVGWTAGLLAGAGLVMWKFGPWPDWKSLAFDNTIARLQFMQFFAVKLGLLTDLLAVGLTVLVVAIGWRYGAGWRSHVQRILIGISTASLSQISAEAIWQTIVHHTTPHSQAEYQRVIGIQEKMLNANSAVYVLVAIWWIVSLWLDEGVTARDGSDAAVSIPAGSTSASEAGDA